MIGLVDGNNFFVSCERVFNRRLVGRPVAVLSNNDGCCVSRSNEFKARFKARASSESSVSISAFRVSGSSSIVE